MMFKSRSRLWFAIAMFITLRKIIYAYVVKDARCKKKRGLFKKSAHREKYIKKYVIGTSVSRSGRRKKKFKRINVACHLRFAKLLSGTEAFCMYLRSLGAKIGNHCSIRAINPVSDSRLISLGAGVHLGDFSRIAAGFYARTGSKVGISKSMITQWLGVKAFYFRVQLLKTT